MFDRFHNSKAMKPFMTDAVYITGPRADGRRVEWSGRACVIDNGFAEPMGSASVATDCRTWTVIVPKEEWVDEEPPRIGDRVEFGGGWAQWPSRTRGAFAVKADGEYYEIDVRG